LFQNNLFLQLLKIVKKLISIPIIIIKYSKNMQTEEISHGIYKTILVPLAKKLGVHPIVLIEEIYNQYGQVRTSPNVVSGLF